MNVPQTDVVVAKFAKRFGLITAKIGASFAHRIGVEMTLEPPEYSTQTKAVGAKTRTRVTPAQELFIYGIVNGQRCPIRAKPGALVYLEVQDITRLDPEEAKLVRWVCNHPDCHGKKWHSKDELARAHGKNKELIEEAERSTQGRAHVCYGVVELAGSPAKDEIKDPKTGKVVEIAEPGEPSTIMLCSDEE